MARSSGAVPAGSLRKTLHRRWGANLAIPQVGGLPSSLRTRRRVPEAAIAALIAECAGQVFMLRHDSNVPFCPK